MVLLPCSPCCRTCGYPEPLSVEVDFSGARTAYHWIKLRRGNNTKQTIVYGMAVPQTVSLSFTGIVGGMRTYCWSDITHKYATGTNSFVPLEQSDGEPCGSFFYANVAGGSIASATIRTTYSTPPATNDPIDAVFSLSLAQPRKFTKTVDLSSDYPDPLSESFVCGDGWKSVPSGWVAEGSYDIQTAILAERRCFKLRQDGQTNHRMLLDGTSFTSCVMPMTTTRKVTVLEWGAFSNIIGVDGQTLSSSYNPTNFVTTFFFNLALNVSAIRLIYDQSESQAFASDGYGVTC